MHGPILASVDEVFAGALGATVGILLIGGGIFLVSQRARLQYALMRAAIDKGITNLPGIRPMWLVSLRNGVNTLVVGFCLFVLGGIVHGHAKQVPMPMALAMEQSGLMSMPDDRLPPPPGGPDDNDDMRDHRPPPRNMNPAMEAWHRAQDQKAVAAIAMGGGMILVLLGGVQIIFAFAEKKFTNAAV
jgi:hypothetical protein